ncbi:MAG: DUF5683 domain-containing protein [Flavobacteriaceae bacterium]
MLNSKFISLLSICLFISISSASSQQKIDDLIISDSLQVVGQDIDPLAPSRAAFYSAILPGLGQAYNKKYWKIPIVYAALGVSTYAYIYNNDNYNRARDAFKLEKAGKPHEFDGSDGGVVLSEETLERVQKSYKEDRDLSLLITVGIYALQIVEASVNAHLMQLNTIDDIDITFRPTFYIDPISHNSVAGVSLSLGF